MFIYKAKKTKSIENIFKIEFHLTIHLYTGVRNMSNFAELANMEKTFYSTFKHGLTSLRNCMRATIRPEYGLILMVILFILSTLAFQAGKAKNLSLSDSKLNKY